MKVRMSRTHSIDIKLFISLGESKWAAICPLWLTKAGKQFDANAVCKQRDPKIGDKTNIIIDVAKKGRIEKDPKSVEITLNVFSTFFGSRVPDG